MQLQKKNDVDTCPLSCLKMKELDFDPEADNHARRAEDEDKR